MLALEIAEHDAQIFEPFNNHHHGDQEKTETRNQQAQRPKPLPEKHIRSI